MHELGLGQIITTTQRRDAIHIAVAPVTAFHDLKPGDHIGLIKQGVAGYRTASAVGLKLIGIVDPYLTVTVKKGQQFWMYLYPNTITSLAHHWTHAAFEEQSDLEYTRDLDRHIKPCSTSSGLLARLTCPMTSFWKGPRTTLSTASIFCEGSKWEGFQVPDEYWAHYEIVSDRSVKNDDRHSFFSCSC